MGFLFVSISSRSADLGALMFVMNLGCSVDSKRSKDTSKVLIFASLSCFLRNLRKREGNLR